MYILTSNVVRLSYHTYPCNLWLLEKRSTLVKRKLLNASKYLCNIHETQFLSYRPYITLPLSFQFMGGLKIQNIVYHIFCVLPKRTNWWTSSELSELALWASVKLRRCDCSDCSDCICLFKCLAKIYLHHFHAWTVY